MTGTRDDSERRMFVKIRQHIGILAMVATGVAMADGGGGLDCGRISCGTVHTLPNGTCCAACNYPFCIFIPTGGSCGFAVSTGGPATVDCLLTTLVGGFCVEPLLGICTGQASSSMVCVFECDPEGGGEGEN